MDKSCFVCGYHQAGGMTLLGICWGWTKEKGKGMEILATKRSDGKYVADFGCKRWTAEAQDFDKIKKDIECKIIEEEI